MSSEKEKLEARIQIISGEGLACLLQEMEDRLLPSWIQKYIIDLLASASDRMNE